MTRKQTITARDSVVMLLVVGILVVSVWIWKQTASETLPLAGLMLICLIVAADNFWSLTRERNGVKMQRRLTTMGIGALIVFVVILVFLVKSIIGR